MLQNRFRRPCQLRIGIAVVHFPDSAKVQQLGCSVALDHDIVRTDVTVHDLIFVHPVQRVHDRTQDLQRFSHAQRRSTVLHIPTEIHSPDKLHDDIRRIVLFKEIMYPRYARDLPQPRHGPCFPDEPIPVVLVQLAPLCVGVSHRQRPGMLTVHQSIGIIFLDRYRDLQIHVPADVGNAETTLAQHLAHNILVPQHRSKRQLMGQIVYLLIIAAVLTHRLILFYFHTSVAPCRHHQSPPFCVLTSPV